ncbi:MAG TPA: hypothetical protein VEN79_01500, partial [Terriglobia bacterium]|nr:hypothetical protein [Terriglobia bacterium]
MSTESSAPACGSRSPAFHFGRDCAWILLLFLLLSPVAILAQGGGDQGSNPARGAESDRREGRIGQ